MNLSLSEVPSMTTEQAISHFHEITAVPSLIIGYFSSLILLIVLGTLVEGNKAKYYTILSLYAILFAAVIAGMILLPNIVQDIANFFRGWFD